MGERRNVVLTGFMATGKTTVGRVLAEQLGFELVDTDTLTYQVPGGMLSNFRNQLKEQKMEDKFDDVFAEIPVVRKALGWIPLVTPTSQIVGVQAMLNVKFGRWKNFSPQAMDIALGYYGRTPAPVHPEVRPADLKKPGMAALRQELAAKGYPTDDEHCVIHAMFPQELEKYFAAKKNSAPTAGAPAAPVATKSAPVAAAATPSTAISSSAPSGEVGEVKKMILTIGDRRVPVTVETLA